MLTALNNLPLLEFTFQCVIYKPKINIKVLIGPDYYTDRKLFNKYKVTQLVITSDVK